MKLRQPPRFSVMGLTEHFMRIQEDLELADAKNLKKADVAERTSRTFRTLSASGPVGQGDDVVLVDATSGAVTVSLPPAADRFKELCIKKIDSSSNAVTVDGDGSETIDDSATLVLASQYDAVRLASDGLEWWIL